ncbi:LysR family transcriptional regulator [Terasakiella sp. SH-1]|uniref:LysR family transcriptional regulator n=1 Tax=Terasakiella sp. SH-1 TaxID=2560057 RepID=UPI0010747A1F|nr:LysR family transcriptional regulator [Terasakiella sp. SH-1]
MNGSTYNQLIVFHAIVAEGSINGAARKLEIAPPSVSNSLKGLEKTVGLPLFTRTTRRIELTEAGHMLCEETAPAMQSLSYALETVQDLCEVPRGKVRLTLPRFVYQLFLKPIFAEFCALYPKIELEVSISDEAVDIIKQGFDLGIRLGDRIEEGMVATLLTPPMKEALFASPDYIRQKGMPKTLGELKEHKLIQYRFIGSKQLAVLELMGGKQKVAVEMPTALIVNDTDMMLDAAKEGVGIGRILEPIVAADLRAQNVLPILQDKWLDYPGLYAYFPQNSQKARRIRVLIDFLKEKSILFWA